MSVVYFVKCDLNGLVKIGFTISVHDRFKSLAAQSPVPLRVLSVIRGEVEDEIWLHRKFRAAHSHGEWFRLNDSDIPPTQFDLVELQRPLSDPCVPSQVVYPSGSKKKPKNKPNKVFVSIGSPASAVDREKKREEARAFFYEGLNREDLVIDQPVTDQPVSRFTRGRRS